MAPWYFNPHTGGTKVPINQQEEIRQAIRDIGKKEKGIIGIKAEGLKFKVEGEDLERFVRIRIANDGPSIKEEDIPKLFEPFFTKGKKRGTGLGLASCQKIVNLHGGNITVRNCLQNTFNRHSRESGNPDSM